MIEIITEHVEMPEVYDRKYQKTCKNNRWGVIDTETGNKVYSGSFENVCLVWHNLNKKYYRDVKNKN